MTGVWAPQMFMAVGTAVRRVGFACVAADREGCYSGSMNGILPVEVLAGHLISSTDALASASAPSSMSTVDTGEAITEPNECDKRPNGFLPAKDAPLGTEITGAGAGGFLGGDDTRGQNVAGRMGRTISTKLIPKRPCVRWGRTASH
ncbi:MAG: hypothetical protein ACLQBD_29410 [Syntrophobacteraceae bacterium]